MGFMTYNLFMSQPIWWWIFSNRTLVFSKKFTVMVLFSNILVNMPIFYSWNFFLPLLVIDCDVAFEIDCFYNNLVLASNWGNSMSLANVVTCFITIPTWCHHWSMVHSTCIHAFIPLQCHLLNFQSYIAWKTNWTSSYMFQVPL